MVARRKQQRESTQSVVAPGSSLTKIYTVCGGLQGQVWPESTQCVVACRVKSNQNLHSVWWPAESHNFPHHPTARTQPLADFAQNKSLNHTNTWGSEKAVILPFFISFYIYLFIWGFFCKMPKNRQKITESMMWPTHPSSSFLPCGQNVYVLGLNIDITSVDPLQWHKMPWLGSEIKLWSRMGWLRPEKLEVWPWFCNSIFFQNDPFLLKPARFRFLRPMKYLLYPSLEDLVSTSPTSYLHRVRSWNWSQSVAKNLWTQKHKP